MPITVAPSHQTQTNKNKNKTSEILTQKSNNRAQDMNAENFETLPKYIKKNLNKWRDILCS